MYIPRTFCNWIILCSYLSSGIRTVWHCKCAIVVVHWLVYNMYKLSPPSSFPSHHCCMFFKNISASLLTHCCHVFGEIFSFPSHLLLHVFGEFFGFPSHHCCHVFREISSFPSHPFLHVLENFLASVAAMFLEKFSTSLVNHCCNCDPLKPFLAADFCQLIS